MLNKVTLQAEWKSARRLKNYAKKIVFYGVEVIAAMQEYVVFFYQGMLPIQKMFLVQNIRSLDLIGESSGQSGR